METRKYRIGIDLGGTNIKAGVIDANNNLICVTSRPTGAERPWKEVAADMVEAVKEALSQKDISVDECISLGIGNPGIVDAKKGEIVFSNNISWKNVPLAEELNKFFDLPIHISNDANCAVLGEMAAGSAKGKNNVVLLTLGTGVGGGVILDGKVFEGAPGGAELGHTTLISGGVGCTCGRKGCVESYCSATALINQANAAVEKHPESIMAEMKKQAGAMNGKIPFDAAKKGDLAATEVVNQYIEWLGEAITNYVNIFRPEVVLLSGGVCGQGSYLTEPLNVFVREKAFGGEMVEVPEIKTASLGNDAGIIGAANLL